MKQIILITAMLLILSTMVSAFPCAGTDASVAGSEPTANTSSTPTINHLCTTNATCAVSLTNISADEGPSVASNAFTTTNCSEQSQVFADFSIFWENVQGGVADAITDAELGGTANDRVFTVGSADNGANVSDMLIQAYNKSTGVPIWERAVSIAGVQMGRAIDWDSTNQTVAVIGQNDTKIMLYVFDQSGTQICSRQIGNGTMTFNGTDVRAGSTVYVSGNIGSIDALALTASAATCAPIAITNVSGSALGFETFHKIGEDTSSNASFAGLFANASSPYAFEAEFNGSMFLSHINGVDVGTTNATNDTFLTVEVSSSDNSIYLGGRLADLASVCAFTNFGASLWTGDCRSYAAGGGGSGQYNDIYLHSTNVYLGGSDTNFASAQDTLMTKYTTAGVFQWARENNGSTESDNDFISSLIVITTVTPSQVIGVGQRDGTNWSTISRDINSGVLEFGHNYNDGASIANVVLTDNVQVYAFGNGTSTGMGMLPMATTATPEFSMTTMLLAVLVAGGMIMFVVRRKR